MKKKKILIVAILIILFFITICQPHTFATGTINTNDYRPELPGTEGTQYVIDRANVLIGVIKTAGIVVAVIMMIILGFKYMTGSVSEKAEYKKTMIPYLVGIILVVSITQLIGILAEMVGSVE